MREHIILKPKNLNLAFRVKHNPPNFKFNYDFAYLIINDIICRTAYRIEIEKMQGGGAKIKSTLHSFFVSLCSTQMQPFFRDYNKHLDYLYKDFPIGGRILFKQNYSVGQCFSYKLNPKYSLTDLEPYMVTDQKLIRKINTQHKNPTGDETRLKFSHLTKFFHPQKLTIDLKAAYEANTALFKADNDSHRYFLNMVKILDLHNGKYWFSNKPDTDGRLHSTITSFPSEFRKYLRYEGKKLSEIDISSSIPFFLFALLKNINLEHKTFKRIVEPDKSFYNSYILVKNSVALDSSEINKFGQEILNGNFYMQFAPDFWSAHLIQDSHLNQNQYLLDNVKKMFGREFDGDESDIEKVIKRNILSMLNAKPNSFRVEEAVFQTRYPTINNFIKKFKRLKYNGLKRHVKFSHLLLQIESYFMLTVLGKKIANRFRSVPFTTLHDCLVTTEENVEKLLSFMSVFFNSELGFSPNFKTKIWD